MNTISKHRRLKVSELTEGNLYYSLYTRSIVKVVNNDYANKEGIVKRLAYQIFSPHFKDPIVVTNIKDDELQEIV